MLLGKLLRYGRGKMSVFIRAAGVGLTALNDGTFITVSSGATELFRFRISDSQLQLPAGVDTDVSI